MSLSVREIIKEACTRINLVPRKQAVPGDILENGYKLLKGVADKYNKDNLLSWTQNSLMLPNVSLIHVYDATDVLKGEYNLYFDTAEELDAYELTEEDSHNNVWAIVKDLPNVYYSVIPVQTEQGTVYTWAGHPIHEPYPQRYQEMLRYQSMYHVQIRDVDKINSIYVVSPSNEEYREITKLDFVNHTDYDRFGNNTKTYTYTQKSQGEWLIEIKPVVSRQSQPYRLKFNYNEGIKFDLDSELYIPDNYIELLIVATAHKLAIMYPRLDEAQMNRLQTEVSVLIDNVKTPNSVDRMIVREDYWRGPHRMTQQELLSGDWLY
jgi:hypothetical protein